jgi:hypothetical protein
VFCFQGGPGNPCGSSDLWDVRLHARARQNQIIESINMLIGCPGTHLVDRNPASVAASGVVVAVSSWCNLAL